MSPGFDRVVILADESANWKVGGLRQLDRLVLALDELAHLISSQRKIDVFIFWRPDIPKEEQWQPKNSRLTRIEFVQVMKVGAPERLLNTRMLVRRRGLEQFLADAVLLENDPGLGDEFAVWSKLWTAVETKAQNDSPRETSQYLVTQHEVGRSEEWLLRGSGKTRDGFVSRYLNRPLSRAVSRVLLRTPMTPNVWTWLILIFPLIGFLLFIRGDYLGFSIGAALFHVHSILDGCDGEIARAKYLDSEKGPGIDAIGDLISLLLFSIGLGFGLFRAAHDQGISHWLFLIEGILTAVFIASRLGPDHVLDLLRRGPAAVVSTQNDDRLRRAGGEFLGNWFTSWAFELTKRDVVFFAFLIMALLGLARWILHLLFVYAFATLLLSMRGRAERDKRR